MGTIKVTVTYNVNFEESLVKQAEEEGFTSIVGAYQHWLDNGDIHIMDDLIEFNPKIVVSKI